jgi:hypothetical protein
MMKVQGDHAQAKRQKMLKKFENSSTKTIAEKSMSLQAPLISVIEILTENLNMRLIAAKFVHRLLTNDQKQRRVKMCLELREKANEDSAFFSRIITGDKSWIYGYDPETKQQSSQWKSPR